MKLINDNILSIVVFLPLVGAILLAFFPRRDRDIRYFALAVSLLTLLASLHLPWYFVRGQSGSSSKPIRSGSRIRIFTITSASTESRCGLSS